MARQFEVSPTTAKVTGQYTPKVLLVDAAGNPVNALSGTAPVLANATTFADLAAATAAYNALLAILRTRGVLAP